MKKIYLIITLLLSTFTGNAQCDPGLINHYNMGDFPFVSSSGVTVSMAGTNSGTLGPYVAYGCSPALCEVNTIRLDPGDALVFNFSQPVYDFTFVCGVLNMFENGVISTNNGVPTLSSNCPSDMQITGNAFEQVGALASPVIEVLIPNGATSITISCFASTQGPGNGVFTVDVLDCIGSTTCNTSSNIFVSSCGNFLSPSGNYTWTTSGIYNDTITNIAGCDSVITLNLTINNVILSITQTGVLLTADEVGATYQWLECPGMTSISGATNQTYTATANGDFAVTVTSNGCSYTSTCYTVAEVGIMENDFENGLILYPNPTNGIITVQGKEIQSVEIANISGQIIKQLSINTEEFIIDMSEQPAGVYMVQIVTKNEILVKKIIMR